MENRHPKRSLRSYLKPPHGHFKVHPKHLFRAVARHSHEYDIVFLVLLVSTLCITTIFFALLLFSYFVLGNTKVLPSLLLCGVASIYIIGIYLTWKHTSRRSGAKLLVLFYTFLAAFAIWTWGINAPFGILLLCIVIILSGILLGSRYTLFAAMAAILLLAVVQFCITAGFHHPAVSASLAQSHFGDVIGYSTLLSVLAGISWLYGRQTEHLLRKNTLAEKALRDEKRFLEIRVKERTSELQQAQITRVQQLYKFAEIGQFSAVLLHDLANHLTSLTFDIVDINKQKQSISIDRAQQSVAQLDAIVEQMRSQLQDGSASSQFSVTQKITESIDTVLQKAYAANVTIEQDKVDDIILTGDPTRFMHVIAILLANGIEAYDPPANDRSRRSIKIKIVPQKKNLKIHIIDWGKGIPKSKRKHLFSPITSTKANGMGVGLFIAHQIMETHFSGSLSLNENSEQTDFVLVFPYHHETT